VGQYEGSLRAIIHAMKYDRRRSIAAPLAGLMAHFGREVLETSDAVVPVPLHWRRHWQRGFNQALLLAEGMGIPVWPALGRVRATRSQVHLSAEERRQNVRGAFGIARRLPWQPRWSDVLEGRVVTLIDDVATTGATLDACARVLRGAGALEVRALTAARVLDPPPCRRPPRPRPQDERRR
jgi:ComF family protein